MSVSRNAIDESIERLVGKQFGALRKSKPSAMEGLKSDDPNVRQACIAIVRYYFEIDNVTVGLLDNLRTDSSPLVRASARNALAEYYRTAGNPMWQSLLCEIVLDENLMDGARIGAYAELLRLSGKYKPLFYEFCEKLETMKVSDLDMGIINSILAKS